ncbi:uncharacterized protein Tco025E_04106 [Trypanosoma conorhini]|uniref:Actin-like protein n=1 Tax=Trypanosoma conorhini TaxID=83891 RepID=A0A422PPV9_9TRYP|nr:uncharacterized protein Tco025E_04106 [Trypanosoma conorhini]RNF19769.1 hypothetical protein Tco025E_04106 [Trypanosoma conorhini]
MTSVAFDIGSCFTKVYFGGDLPGRRVFETPVGVRQLKQRFDLTSTSMVLDSFLRRLCSTASILACCKEIEVLVSPGDSTLFAQYVSRWFASASWNGVSRVVDAFSWLLEAQGANDGCVVDIGYQATRVVPILSSIPVVEAIALGSGMRELLALTVEGWASSPEAASASTSPQPLVAEVSQCILAILEEAVMHCNRYTQRPFVCGLFLLTGGGVAVEGVVGRIHSSLQKRWPNSRLLVLDTASPLCWSPTSSS